MSNAVQSTGISVSRGVGSPPVYTEIGEITKVVNTGLSRNKKETSTHNDGTESYQLGILRQKDPGFSINWIGTDATHIAILDDILNNDKRWWKFEFPSGTTAVGQGLVQSFMIGDSDVDEVQKADVMLVWTGPISIT